jgi:NAD(P)-dependent dehydrogenase (short-subunit alcohol dehydrogenase family)
VTTPADTAVVIGANGAVGAAIVQVLGQRDIPVIGTSRANTQKARQTDTVMVEYEAGDCSGVMRLCDAVADRRIVALFYCVGRSSSKRAVTDTPLQEWTELWRVNVAGFVHVTTALMPQLRAAQARIVALGSQAVETCRSLSGPYTATKAALEAVVITLAKEEARHGVRVNVLAPSLVRSAMAEQLLAAKGVADPVAHYASLPWGRPLEPHEVADAAVSLALDSAWAYASGQRVPLSAVDR